MSVLVGIYFTGEEYRTVVLEEGRDVRTVIFRGEFLSEKAGELVEKCSKWLNEGEVRATFEPHFFHYKLLEIPFKSPRKILKVLPLEMEQEVPLEAGEMSVGYYSLNSHCVGMAVKKSLLQERVEKFDTAGMMVDVVTDPVFSFSHWLKEDACMVVWEKKWALILLHRGELFLPRVVRLTGGKDDVQRIGREVKRTLHLLPGESAEGVPLVVTGESISFREDAVLSLTSLLKSEVKELKPEDAGLEWGYPRADFHRFAVPLAIALNPSPFNFRTGELAPPFRKGLPLSHLRFLGILTLISLIFLNAGAGILKNSYRQTLDLLKAKELNVFVDAFPEVKKVVDPYEQMKQKMEKLAGGAGEEESVSFTQVLYSISRAVQASQVKLEEVAFFEGRVDIYGIAEEVALMETFIKRLEEEPVLSEVKLVLSRREKDRNVFKFRVKGKVR